MYDEVAWLTEVFENDYGQKLLGLHGWDNYHLGTTDPWDTVEDLQGVKVGGAGPNLPWLEFAGAVPVQSTLPDGYLSLQTGVYNGWLMFPSAYLGFKFYEPAPHYTLIGFGAMAVNGLTMNSRSFDRLPPEVQTIIMEVGRGYEDQAGATLNARQEAGLKGLEDVGAEHQNPRRRRPRRLGLIPHRLPRPTSRRRRRPRHARHRGHERLPEGGRNSRLQLARHLRDQ